MCLHNSLVDLRIFFLSLDQISFKFLTVWVQDVRVGIPLLALVAQLACELATGLETVNLVGKWSLVKGFAFTEAIDYRIEFCNLMVMVSLLLFDTVLHLDEGRFLNNIIFHYFIWVCTWKRGSGLSLTSVHYLFSRCRNHLVGVEVCLGRSCLVRLILVNHLLVLSVFDQARHIVWIDLNFILLVPCLKQKSLVCG